MKDFRNASPRDILHYITKEYRSQDVAKKCKYVILGKNGSTGKTWLKNRLTELGYDAIEISEEVCLHVDYRDNYNHVIEDPYSNSHMTIILNRPYVKYFPTVKPIRFTTAEAAYRILGKLHDVHHEYGCITVEDYCVCADCKYSDIDEAYGWTDISGFKIERSEGEDVLGKTFASYFLIPTKPIVLE